MCSRTKPKTFSAMFLPLTNNHSWLVVMATPTLLSLCMHAAGGDYFLHRAACVATI